MQVTVFETKLNPLLLDLEASIPFPGPMSIIWMIHGQGGLHRELRLDTDPLSPSLCVICMHTNV